MHSFMAAKLEADQIHGCQHAERNCLIYLWDCALIYFFNECLISSSGMHYPSKYITVLDFNGKLTYCAPSIVLYETLDVPFAICLSQFDSNYFAYFLLDQSTE